LGLCGASAPAPVFKEAKMAKEKEKETKKEEVKDYVYVPPKSKGK